MSGRCGESYRWRALEAMAIAELRKVYGDRHTDEELRHLLYESHPFLNIAADHLDALLKLFDGDDEWDSRIAGADGWNEVAEDLREIV